MPSPSEFLPLTSETLLQLMGEGGDRKAREAAWNRFVRLYGPAIQAWGRKYGVPDDELDELSQTVLIKLHRAMNNWEFRRWLKIGVQQTLAQMGPHESLRSFEPNVMREASDGELQLLVPFHRRLFSDSDATEQRAVWKKMVPAFRTMFARALIASGQEVDHGEVLSQLLEGLGNFACSDQQHHLPRFHSWLHMVVRNAAFDCADRLRGRYKELSENLPARQNLVAELELREIRELGEQRARQNVAQRNWRIYEAITCEGQDPDQIALEHEMKLNAVQQVVSRVKRQVLVEMQKLQDEIEAAS